MKDKKKKRHNYQIKVEAMLRAGVIPVDYAHVGKLDVYHDDWCGINSGDYCDCDPNINFTRLWWPAMEN